MSDSKGGSVRLDSTRAGAAARSGGRLLPAGIVLLPWLLGCQPDVPDYYPGYIEVDALELAPAQSGRLEQLPPARGQAVAAGELLFALEAEREQAALAEATARLDGLKAQLRDLSSGARAPERGVIRARLAQARTSAEASEREAERREELVAARLLAAEQAEQARARADADRQRVRQLELELEVAGLPARSDQIAAVAAQMEAQQAVLAQAQWAFDQRRLLSPVAGWVRERYHQPGEWVGAGQPVLSLLPQGGFELRFFVPTDAAGGLLPGSPVVATGDALATSLDAVVTHVADQPEYAPPLIYSRDRDELLLFQVRARIEVPAGTRLNPGLPVQVRRP